MFSYVREPFTWILKVQNQGRLPAARFAVLLHLSRNGKVMKKRKVYGSSDCGEHILSVQDRREHCGIISYCTEELRVFDYLSLFSGKRKMEEKDMQTFSLPGNNYEEETKGRAVLFLDLTEGKNNTESARDAFYTLLQALVSGLLQTASSVRVYWKQGGGRTENYGKEKAGSREMHSMDIEEDEQCNELLRALYQMQENSGGIEKNILQKRKRTCGRFCGLLRIWPGFRGKI